MSSAERVAVVTGAAQGLGLETCRGLADQGYRVVLTARSEDAVARGLAALGDGEGVEGRVLDAADQASVDAFFDGLLGDDGRIDVLVNNAGRTFGSLDDSLLHTPAERLADAFENNSLSAWRMIQKALPAMNAAGYGRIVNVSSGLGELKEMCTGAVAYRISKTAMNAITRIASNETKGNVKVNAVCPGWVRTAMGGADATRSLAEGVEGILWAATLPDDGPNGGFFRDGQAIDW